MQASDCAFSTPSGCHKTGDDYFISVFNPEAASFIPEKAQSLMGLNPNATPFYPVISPLIKTILIQMPESYPKMSSGTEE